MSFPLLLSSNTRSVNGSWSRRNKAGKKPVCEEMDLVSYYLSADVKFIEDRRLFSHLLPLSLSLSFIFNWTSWSIVCRWCFSFLELSSSRLSAANVLFFFHSVLSNHVGSGRRFGAGRPPIIPNDLVLLAHSQRREYRIPRLTTIVLSR